MVDEVVDPEIVDPGDGDTANNNDNGNSGNNNNSDVSGSVAPTTLLARAMNIEPFKNGVTSEIVEPSDASVMTLSKEASQPELVIADANTSDIVKPAKSDRRGRTKKKVSLDI